MYGLGVAFGIVPNIDRVSFIGDVGLGLRWLDHSRTSTRAGVADPPIDLGLSGSYAGLGVGLSIPAGPIRIVPKASFTFGSLTPSDSTTLDRAAGRTPTDSVFADDDGSYQTFFVGIAVFYSLDLGRKKAAPTASASGPRSL